MAKVLITGGGSYLGQHLVPLAATMFDTSYTVFRHDPQHEAPGYQLDVRDATAVRSLISHLRPEVIIHTVGSNLGEDMAEVIVQGTRHVTAAAQDVGARLIHISTDVVFDGRHGPYAEDAPLTPIHAYGRAKASAEALVAAHADHVIVRTSLIYGLEGMDRGTAWIAAALRRGEPVTLFTDQLRNPVWVQTLCRACLELAGQNYSGILHVAGDQVLSRADFGLRMLDWWGVAERSALQFGLSDPERWPVNCTLDLGRARALLVTPLPGVDEVLQNAASGADF
jgi:dTDP-4-dehydrorhamnose reductase